MSSSLKIAQIFSSDPNQAGGVQEHLFYLCQSLEKLGHHIEVFGPVAETPKWDFPHYHEISQPKQIKTPNGNRGNITIPTENIEENINYIQSNFDLVHLHEPYIPITAWKLAANLDLPIVGSFHTGWNSDSNIAGIKHLLPFFKASYSKHFAGSIYISDLVEELWSVIADDQLIQRKINYGIAPIFQPADKQQSQTVSLLFLGRLVKRKGVHFLLKAISQLHNKQAIELIIVGDGQDRALFERLTQKYQLQDVVKFVGEVVGDERVKYYQHADIFCAPYADEGFGLTILEALACGCPIVGFSNQAFQDSLADYPAPVLLAAQQDVVGLTKALDTAINSPKLRAQLSQWGVKRSQDFSWEKNALETVELYQQILT